MSILVRGLRLATVSPYGIFAIAMMTVPLHAQNQVFSVKSYQGKCLDFGAPPQVAGTPVFIYDCNGTVAQQVRVVEVNAHHDVVLYAGSKVIGVKLPPPVIVIGSNAMAPAVAPPIADYQLELQNRLNPIQIVPGPNPQVFALDGDSILLAANRKLAVTIQNARGTNRTPLTLSPRMLADNEFWDFNSSDGSGAFPTTGFVSITSPRQLESQLIRFNSGMSTAPTDKWWGTVLVIGPDASMDFVNRSFAIPDGVTLRGNRRTTNLGPELAVSQQAMARFLDLTLLDGNDNPLTGGDHVRITGLRVRGPSRSRSVDSPQDSSTGIRARDDRDVIIDHNDLSDWPEADIEVFGSVAAAAAKANGNICPDPRPSPATLSPIDNVRITHNFLHHNEKSGGGYGVVMSSGGNATIEGNTFLMNRHAIADDGAALSRYHAYDNLVLSNVPTYGVAHGPQQDFDVHGTDPSSGSQHTGGFAGNQIDIAWNTFLGGNRFNFTLRGSPCTTSALPDYFRNNFSQQQHDAIKNDGGSTPYGVLIDGTPFGPAPYLLNINANRFSASDPTNHFGVGDFDGDGIDDIFLASGTAFFYSPGGVAEWRQLGEGRTDRIESLLFGDFDGDGRTDVIGKNGDNIMVSWGGLSDWEVLNQTTAPITDLAVGDFDGDGRADIFWADGQQWRVAYGGIGPFGQSQTSSIRVKDLLFGQFGGTGATDVLGLEGGSWHVSYGARSSWTRLSGHSESLSGMVAADFDGDGKTDVARSVFVYTGILNGYYQWQYSSNGVDDWKPLNTGVVPISMVPAIGHFTGHTKVDTLIWNRSGPADLAMASGVGGSFSQRSRQEMR